MISLSLSLSSPPPPFSLSISSTQSWRSFKLFNRQCQFSSSFSRSSLLSDWSWRDPSSYLEYTRESIYSKQADCDICGFSDLLLFFFCKDDTDRLMRRASCRCCTNFSLRCAHHKWQVSVVIHAHKQTNSTRKADIYNVVRLVSWENTRWRRLFRRLPRRILLT